MNRNTECEIEENSGWRAISVVEALERDRSEPKRCPECHGRVRVEKSGGKTPAHYEHMEKNDGCSHSYRFDGRRRMHPNPLE
jgi:hypothetical protein